MKNLKNKKVEYMMSKRHNSGISLIVLVITIIVIIILAGAVILSLADNNPIVAANEATFKANISEYSSELAMAISNKYLEDNSFTSNSFNAGVWDGNLAHVAGTVKEYITSMKVADAPKFEIQSGKLVYVGDEQVEIDYLTEIGIISGEVTPKGLGVNVIATDNTTVNGGAASYNNPIIPKGFKAINTTDASWTNLSTDWNLGLVIEDEAGNQFVWVPVDGVNVPYAKWTTTGVPYSDSNLSDDTLPSNFNEQDQITKYKGFYIARYESMFDYNAGNIRAASKRSTNTTDSHWATSRNSVYNGYLWNFINYTDSKAYAENMDTSYGYDTSKVGTNLITGTQWDTVMKWIQNSGKSVTDSTTWGNHYNSSFSYEYPTLGTKEANTRILLVSGASSYNKVNNTYDLTGNLWEITNETYNANRIFRGGGYYGGYLSSNNDPAATRYSIDTYSLGSDCGFRVVLYVL